MGKWWEASISCNTRRPCDHEPSRSWGGVAGGGASTGHQARIPRDLNVLHCDVVSMRISGCRRVWIGRGVGVNQKPIVGIFHAQGSRKIGRVAIPTQVQTPNAMEFPRAAGLAFRVVRSREVVDNATKVLVPSILRHDTCP